MRKYYYVCPRCGRCYKRYIPRRKAKCAFCSTVWKTRKAKGTRSAFSWTATLTTILGVLAIAFLAGREFGAFSKTPKIEKTHSWETELETAPESVEDAANVESGETSGATETLESGETSGSTETSEDAAE
ncbi:MAG: hypothetical protein IKW13_04925 [Thermoguttaceae bacterium]|nr:hypothetical protein [Thermoguttaceae bacterium]